MTREPWNYDKPQFSAVELWDLLGSQGMELETLNAEIERLREQAAEDQRVSFSWMAKHDRLLGFIQARPMLLKELIEEDARRALENKP